MSNNKKLITGFGILVLLILAVGAGKLISSANQVKGYSIVYLSSGEIYVGHLSTFPRFKLTGTYLLQNVKSQKDVTKSDLQLFPLAEAVWAPTELYVNPKQVLFYGSLDPNSAAAKGINAKGK